MLMNPIIAFLFVVSASAAEMPVTAPIPLLYEERPPYQIRNGDVVDGLVGAPSDTAFKAAGVPFKWEASSQNRLLTMLRENQSAVCAVSLFKNPERLEYAKYTKAVYRDHPIVALVRRQFVFAPGNTLNAALTTPGLRLLVRSKYSYGRHIDGMLLKLKPETVVSPLHNLQLIDLLKADRADMLFAAEEEADLLLRQAAAANGDILVVHFSDAEPGEERHIACSRKVPDEIIERLNKGISFK
jgi:polar amino acid transport system substrate-binding protein